MATPNMRLVFRYHGAVIADRRSESGGHAPDANATALTSRHAVASPRVEDSHWMPEIDGLRAIACLVVVYDHFTPWGVFWRLLTRGWLYPFWDNTAKTIAIGSMGVMLFYSISSFLLTYLAVREWIANGHFSPKQFLIRRTLRIWPLYYTILLAYVGLAFLAKTQFPGQERMVDPAGWFWGAIVVYPLFLQNWFTPGLPEAGILWSLAIEEQFYLVFPWVMLLIFRRRLDPAWVVGGLILVTFAFTSLFVFGFRTEVGLYYSTPTFFAIFALGAAAGWAFALNGPTWARLSDVFRRHRVPLGLLLLVGIGVAGYRGNDRFFPPYTLLTPPTFLVLAACFAGSIVWILSNRESLVARILKSRVMRDLGFLSFGIYMWHTIVKVLIFYRVQDVDLSKFPTDARFAMIFVSYILGSVALATLTYCCVEQPFLRLKDRFSASGPIREGTPPRGSRGTTRFLIWYFALPATGVIIIEAIFRQHLR